MADVDAVNRLFSSFITRAKREGIIRIIPLVSVDNIIAASILNKVLTENGFEVVISLKPSIVVNEPTIFLDLDYCSNEQCMSIVYDKKTSGLSIENENTILTNSSISATIAEIVEYYWVTDFTDKGLAIIGGIDRNLDLNKNGFMGLEAKLVADLDKSNKVFSEIGFRLWGWKRRKLIEILAYTLSPYLPGITGSIDKAVEFLQRLGVKDPFSMSSGDIVTDTKLLKLLAEKLITLIKSSSFRERSPIEIIGKLYFIDIFGKIVDLLDLYGMYLVLMSLVGDYLINLFYLPYDTGLIDRVYGFYERIIEDVVKEVSEHIELYRLNKKLPYINAGIIKRPEVYVRILNELGLLDEKDPVYMRDGGKYYTVLSEFKRTNKKIVFEEISDEQVIEVSGLV